MSCSETEESSTFSQNPTITFRDNYAVNAENNAVTSNSTDMSEAELSEFWDQEKYLSEHHYEEAVDEDSARRLLSFGDDYRNFIDSLSDGLSSVPETNSKRRELFQTKRKSKKSRIKNTSDNDSCSDDYDSINSASTNEIYSEFDRKLSEASKHLTSVIKSNFSDSEIVLVSIFH